MDNSTPINGQDYRVRELTSLCLTLRADLVFTPHHDGGEVCYLIEDTVRSQFFRIGMSEYLLISMFDGRTTIGEALTRLARVQGDHAMTEAEATTICKWLISSELACTPASIQSDRLAETANDREAKKRLGTWNPLCLKLPLFYPDRFFAQITPWFRHAFGIAAAVVGLIVLVIAVQRVGLAWDQFAQSARGISSPSRWIWLAVCWLALKVIHEAAHGIVCRKYGGHVHEAGAIFVLFAPLAYVDLTSSWRFRSKWQRIHTAAAGMYIELWIAGLAAIAWSVTQPGLINDLCFNLVVMASLTTIIFNANPLMRFDGYYMLSDLLEIPNLYSEGQQYLQALARKCILGEPLQPQLSWKTRDVFIRVYGVAAFLWRIFICVWLVIGASILFHGVGLILAVIAVVLWIGVPLVRLFKYVRRDDGDKQHRTTRFVIATSALIGLATICFGTVPWPGSHRAHAIVQYEPLAFVRADSPGFVREIFVIAGQTVRAGQPLVRLQNRELLAELNDLELAIEQSVHKCRVFKQADEMHSYQAELEQQHSYRTKKDEKQQQVDKLVLRSPVDGEVIARDLELKLGTYLNVGDQIAAVGDESRKELRMAIKQSDFEHFKHQIGQGVRVRLPGGVVFQGTIDRVVPRASSVAPHESMYASNGGPLANRANSESADQEGRPELLSPHFTGVVPLSDSQSRQVRVGQRGVVWFSNRETTIGRVLVDKIRESLPRSFIRQYAIRLAFRTCCL